MKSKLNIKLLLITLFIFTSCSKSIDYNLEKEYFKEEQGILYYKGTPFNGEIFTLYPNGNIKDRGEFVEGKSKIWEWYNQEGFSIVKGKKIKIEEGNNLESFFEITYEPNTSIKEKESDVLFSGMIISRREEFVVKNGEIIRETQFSKNGDIETINEVLSKNLLKETKYYDNDNIKSVGNLIIKEGDYLRDGEWIHYYDNGNVEEIFNYKKNKKEGKYFYFKNGNISLEGTYKNDLRFGDWVVYDNEGKESEIWSYDENGVFMKPIFELQKSTSYYISGYSPFYTIKTNFEESNLSEFELKIYFKNIGLKNLKIDKIYEEYEEVEVFISDSNKVTKPNKTGFLIVKLKPKKGWRGHQFRRRKIQIQTNMEEQNIISLEILFDFLMK